MSSFRAIRIRPWLFGALLALACCGFIALGNWQLRRLAWKLDLIARVDARLKATPIAPPGRPEWPRITAVQDEYRRICADGTLLNDRTTLVQAVTRLGPGDWVLTPLQRTDGSWILVNRGFIDASHRTAAALPAGDSSVHLCGLLRMTEPGGAFLHANDPEHNRWYSRDIAAIARVRGLDPAAVAPYFIDAEAAPDPERWPVGGLTVVHFRNSHLSYAITWYGLAMLSAAGLALLIRHQIRSRVQSAA